MSVQATIIRAVARAAMVPEPTIGPDTRLAALGIGSLEQIECVLGVEEELRVELDPHELWRTRTVQDLIDAVERARAAQRPPSA